MMLAAAERTTKITSTGIARMCQKANATVSAMSDALGQARIAGEDRVDRVLVLMNKRINTLVHVPVFVKREEIADGNDKKARDSVTISNLYTPSCYLIDAKASRGARGFFHRLALIIDHSLCTNGSVPIS